MSLGFWVLAGSRDEPPAISGSSHFLEHLLFKGTESRSARDIAEAFDAVGGDLNAFTSKEYTCYYARILDKDLELAVDHLRGHAPALDAPVRDLDGERQAILEEIHMHEDAPRRSCTTCSPRRSGPTIRSAGRCSAPPTSIKAATREKVRRFYRKHYVPGQLIVAAAGNLRHERTPPAARRADGRRRVVESGEPQDGASGPTSRPRLLVAPADQAAEDRAGAHLPGDERPARSDPDRFAFPIVNGALGTGMSSRLFQEIREKRGLAYSVYSYHSQYTEAGLFAFAGTTPVRAPEAIALLRGELDDVAGGGLTEEEFERAKGQGDRWSSRSRTPGAG